MLLYMALMGEKIDPLWRRVWRSSPLIPAQAGIQFVPSTL
jgi:hypothetical protein